MEKKFEMTNEIIGFEGKVLHRIRALRDFGDVKKGDLGGFIEKEDNLSQRGNSWVYDNAKVCYNALVTDDAYISENARVYGYAFIADSSKIEGCAIICDHASIGGTAVVKDNALIREYASIMDNVRVFDYADVKGKACIYDNAKVYGHSSVEGQALVKGNAEIYDCGLVRHEAIVKDSGKVSQNQIVSYGITKTDLSKNLVASIKAQCNLPVINNKIIAYKLVRPDFTSFYDKNFKYEVGKVAEVENCDMTNKSCATGLHFSGLTYWEQAIEYEEEEKEFICLEAEIDLDDVITVQEGKIRCKRAKILRAFTMS